MQKLIVLCVYSLCVSLTACGAAPVQVSDAQSIDSAQTLQDACNFTGTWAIRFEIPVQWPASVAVEAGSGTVYQWAKVERQHHGMALHDAVSVCGTRVPDSRAREEFNRELYGIDFPDSLFDSGKLPTTTMATTLAGQRPGDAFAMGGITVTLGLDMPQADTAVWPSRARDLRTLDTDGDGHPGITLWARQAPPYSGPPVNVFRTKHAAKFYVALRNVVQRGSGKIDSCDAMSGTAIIPVIGNKAALNSHIVGCQRTDGKACSLSEADMVDKAQSGYNLAGAAKLTMRRVTPQTSCAQIRAM
jgi:hypothetical protein